MLEQINNKEFAERLRKLADIYEANDSIPQLYDFRPKGTAFVFCHDAAEFHRTVKAFGAGTKHEDKLGGENIYFLPSFFPQIRINAVKSEVCERIVVGTEDVPEVVIPACAEKVIPAHTREIVEWRCKPFTAVEDESETAAA